MKKFYLSILAVFCFSLVSTAQKVQGSIKGRLQDSATASMLSDATVSLMSLPDSSLISFTLSDNNGFFEIKNINAGDYVIASSFVGLRSFKRKISISATNSVVDLGTIKLQRADNLLDEVIISEAPVKINGDTISFKADAFKTKPNATVEDLLKKLPGVQVDRDGTVKAQGENVQKVYVDGKEFFSNDPKLATKNLTAEMVDRVEVYDDMSEQAKFNGIDDGSRSKAINLKLKKDKKKGVFGKAFGGYGTDERYDAGITANYFKGATQANIIAKSNNTNNMSYTMNDMLGMFGGGGTSGAGGGMTGGASGGGGMVMMGGGGMNSGGGGGASMGGINMGATGGGITRSSQAGLNYRDTWSQYFDVNGSYFFNNAQTDNVRKTFRQNIATDSSINSDDRVISKSANSNHRFNFNMIYSIDSFNSLIFTPNVNFQNSKSLSDDTLMSEVVKKAVSYKTNESRTISDNIGEGHNISNNLLWRRKFRKPGRTLSVNLSNTLSNNDRDAYSIISSRNYNEKGDKWRERLSNFLTTTGSSTNSYGVNLSYTEPIARDKIWEVNYSRYDNRSTSDRRTFDKNQTTGAYDKVVDSLTNYFENVNKYDRIGTNLRIVKKKYNYQVGFSIQQTLLESNNISKQQLISQNFTNLFPTASFNYNFQRSRTLRFSYRGRTNQPSVSQLQDVTEVNNYPYLTKGNPGLRQEFSHNFMLTYNFFNILKFKNMFAFVTYNNTQNKIANSIQNLPGGVQLTMPVNVSGVYNVSGNFNFGFPIKRMQGGNFNTTTRLGYNQDVSLVNNETNYTRNLSVGEDLRLNYNYKEKLDVGISASVSYNQVRYSLQQNNNTKYFTHVYSADMTYSAPMNLIMATDFDYTFNTGRSDGFNQNYAIWNASIAKQIFKNRRGEIKASVFDILNQNTSLYRNVAQNYIEDVQNTVLKRYFMLTFTLNINRMGGKNMPGAMGGPRGFRIN